MSIEYDRAIARRFRGFLPVIVDVETGGFNPKTDALLEVAMVTVRMDENSRLRSAETVSTHIEPFDGANLDFDALEFNGIDPYSPLRGALPEKEALIHCFQTVRKAVKQSGCKRAILVGHNAAFDHSFISAAVERHNYKRNPFHPFSTLDTVSLGALAYGETVLAQLLYRAGIKWNQDEAHSAIYDAQKTAELFCTIVNQWKFDAAD